MLKATGEGLRFHQWILLYQLQMILQTCGFKDRQELVENTVMRDLRPSVDYMASIAISSKRSHRNYTVGRSSAFNL